MRTACRLAAAVGTVPPATGTTASVTSWSRASARRNNAARIARPLPLAAGINGAR